MSECVCWVCAHHNHLWQHLLLLDLCTRTGDDVTTGVAVDTAAPPSSVQGIHGMCQSRLHSPTTTLPGAGARSTMLRKHMHTDTHMLLHNSCTCQYGRLLPTLVCPGHLFTTYAQYTIVPVLKLGWGCRFNGRGPSQLIISGLHLHMLW